MPNTFAYAVVALDHALIWKDGLEPSSKPLMLEASSDNPEYRKERRGHRGDRDKSVMDHLFAELIVSELKGASHIYLLSAGTGKANSAQQLLEFIKAKHPEMAEKVLATGSADVNALSDNQLLVLGRDRKLLYMRTNLQLT